MCDGEFKAFIKIIKGETDNLINHFEKENNICELALNRLELVIELLMDEKNKEKTIYKNRVD